MKNIPKIIFIIFCCFIFSSAKSQNWQWAKGAIGSGAQEGWDVATDDSGNVYLAGFLQSPSNIFGSDTVFVSGSSDAFLVKYDATGNVIWAKVAGGSQSDYGFGVATDHFGNVFLTGDFQSPTGIFNLDFSETNFTPAQIQVYDILGKLIFQSSIKNPTSKIDLTGNPDGIYFYRIADEKGNINSGKIMVK
jgi:hypothetical protein